MRMMKTLVIVCMLALGVPGLRAESEGPVDLPNDTEPPKEIVKEVTECIKRLGADNFRERRKATRRLVEIGNFPIPKDGGKTTPYRTYVRDKVKALFSDADPEVSGRAREVVQTLFPYGDVDPDTIELKVHIVDPENDRLSGLAENYGSRVDWIKAANPGLKNDLNLRSRPTVLIPVTKDDGWGDHDHQGMVIEID